VSAGGHEPQPPVVGALDVGQEAVVGDRGERHRGERQHRRGDGHVPPPDGQHRLFPLVRPDVPGGEERLDAAGQGDGGDAQEREGQAHPPQAPPLQRGGLARGRQGAERAQQVTRVPPHERAQLGRAGHPAGGGERLAELVRGEIAQRPLVHPVRIAAHGQHQHYVAEVDGLPPGRRADLGESGVDQQQRPTASTSQAVVLNLNGCGSGGGAPVGRRCRAVRGAGPGGAAGASVCSVFSLTGHPAFLGRAA
jgi:hypothetical protein